MASSVLAPTPALCLASGPSVSNNPSNPSDDAQMDRLNSLRTGFTPAQACESIGNTSPLYSVSPFALMTTIMTDIERPHYTAISPLPLGTFVFALLLDLSYIHTNKHILTTNDHGHNWEYTCIMPAHLHMRSHARLSIAGSFKRHSANSLRTEHQCDCSARKLALGRTYTGRSFLEEEQQHYRAFTESKRLTHCAYFNKNPTFGDNLRNQAFWTLRLPRLGNNETGTLSRLKT